MKLPGLFLAFAALLVTAPAARSQRVRIVTMGDSITRGARPGVKADETFSALLQARLRDRKIQAEVVNVGQGGERTDQALVRLARDVIALKPAVVVVMYGTNDSFVDPSRQEARLSAEDYGKNLEAILAGLRNAGIRPVLMTPPRWGDKAKRDGAGASPNVRLEKYVEKCRQVAARTKTPLVDNFAHWTREAKAGADIGSWTTDECHPNPRGHRAIADQLLPIVLPQLRPEKRD